MSWIRKHWKAVTAATIALLAVVVGSILVANPWGQAPAPAPTEDTAGGSVLGFPVSKVKIGEGGTRTAVDGTTPVGYPSTCDGAAAAAANYAPVVWNKHPSGWAQQRKVLQQISTSSAELKSQDSLQPSYQRMLKMPDFQRFDKDWVDRVDVKAGGLYRVVECTANDTALVQVFYGVLTGRDPESTRTPGAYFLTQALRLKWQDGDWKIQRSLPVFTDGSGQDPLLQVPDVGPLSTRFPLVNGRVPTLTQEMADKAFARTDATRKGWIEYANATR